MGYVRKFQADPTELGGVKNFGLKWHMYSLIRGPKWTKPGLIVTIYSINIHAQKKIWSAASHLQDLALWNFSPNPLIQLVPAAIYCRSKVTPIKKVNKIDPPKSTTHYSMNIFSDSPTPWYRQGCHLAVFRVAMAHKWAKMAKIDYLKNLVFIKTYKSISS